MRALVGLATCSNEGRAEKAGEKEDSAIDEGTTGEVKMGNGALETRATRSIRRRAAKIKTLSMPFKTRPTTIPTPNPDRAGLTTRRFSILVAILVAALMFVAPPRAKAQMAVPQGVWLIDGRAAVEIYDCQGLMCGRIAWLAVPRNSEGQLDRDSKNPDPKLRQRSLCGLTILWNLQPKGVNRWRRGWFYNPRNGVTYRVSAQLASDDLILARIYVAMPLLGQTKTLVRIPKDTTEGWC
jgi:uncharacterized protein (DUF2147 family)